MRNALRRTTFTGSLVLGGDGGGGAVVSRPGLCCVFTATRPPASASALLRVT